MNQTTLQKEKLNFLFEIHLEFEEDASPVHKDGKVGDYIGSGVGTVTGPNLKGDVHWTLFEDQNETVCESNLFGLITTDDGAQIHFDSLGFFAMPDENRPQRWATTASVRFDTDDGRYTWLNAVLGIWEGEFDVQCYCHHYRVYAPQKNESSSTGIG